MRAGAEILRYLAPGIQNRILQQDKHFLSQVKWLERFAKFLFRFKNISVTPSRVQLGGLNAGSSYSMGLPGLRACCCQGEGHGVEEDAEACVFGPGGNGKEGERERRKGRTVRCGS